MLRVEAEPKLPGRVERPDPGFLVQHLSTEGLAPREQYSYWKEAVCGIFVGLDCRREGRGTFHSAVVRRTFELDGAGSASFIDVVSEGQSAVRSPRQISRASDAWLMLALQTRGPATLS